MATRTQPTVPPSVIAGAIGAFMQHLVEATGNPTIEAQQVRLLMALYVHGQLNQTDLPKYIGVERSAISRNIAKMGTGMAIAVGPGKVMQPGMGIIEAFDDELDRRFKLVRLTPQGRALVESCASQVIPFFTFNPTNR